MSAPFPSAFDADPGPWNAVTQMVRNSGRLQNAIGHAQVEGARNLLRKAIGHLADGDAQRAEQLMLRAARMPYDAPEEDSPGVRAASVLVLEIISDFFEESAYHDFTWLEVPIAVHDRLDATGRAEVASIVHGFVLQKTLYTTSAAEKRRIRQVFGDAPLEADLGDAPTATAERRLEIIRSLITAAMVLDDGYAAAWQA